jgi:TrmH family RNA methyltransferase
MSLLLANISIIVVEPKTPGNIGSIARACQNLGIHNIILINPCDYLVDDAYRLAKNAKKLLFDMETRDTLEDCLKDHNILIGTTQRRREKQAPFYGPSDMIEKIRPYSQESKIGIVFGRENNGLTNTELDYCNFHSCIPAHEENSVFNLSQAVLIYAYECFNASNAEKDPYIRPPATKYEEQLLYQKFETTLSHLPIDTQKGSAHFINLFKRVLGRTLLEKRDIRLFYKLFDLIKNKASHAPNKN